jgi:NTE family protein
LAASLDIMQDRLSRARLAGDPPDLLLSPRLGHVEPLEFSGGQPTIEEGCACVQRMLPALDYLLGAPPPSPQA